MFTNLLAKIEAELNETIAKQEKSKHDIHIATKKLQLLKLAEDYIKLEGRFKQLAGIDNNIY